MVTLDVVVQEFASDTVTVYVPAATPVMLAVVAALLHADSYMGLCHLFHLLLLIHHFHRYNLMSVFTTELADNTVGSVMVTLDVVVQNLHQIPLLYTFLQLLL